MSFAKSINSPSGSSTRKKKFWGAKSFKLSFFAFVLRALLSLRYRIKVRGLEELKRVSKSWENGILFLPNHVAHIDPLLIFAYFLPLFPVRPLVAEELIYHRIPFFRSITRLIKAISIPDLEHTINQFKAKRMERAIEKVEKELKKGEVFLIYPSRKFKNSGKEIVGGSSGVHTLIEKCPEAHVVLVRFSGFWGSSFSKALTGKSPSFSEMILQGGKAILKNLIFFTPRRTIYLDIEPDPKDFPKHSSRLAFNQYLERWYNRYTDDRGNVFEVEPLKLVRYSLWSRTLPKIDKNSSDQEEIPPLSLELREKVYRAIQEVLKNPNLNISPEMSLGSDLGLDSLNIAELVAYLSRMDTFDIEKIVLEDLDTVDSLLRSLAKSTKPPQPFKASNFCWPKEKRRPSPSYHQGKTLPEAFFHSCQKMGSFAACADDLIGVLSYKQIKRAVLVLAHYFRQIPESRIAVLLPSSTATFLLILAIQTAKKTPVMLNWTLGSFYLEEMMKLSHAQRIISSWRFMERANYMEVGDLVDQIVFLEDIRAELSFSSKLWGLGLSICPVKFLARFLKLEEIEENREAVVLFTSGSEASPKGVPLSHQNILSSVRSSLWNFFDHLSGKDVVFSFLPPFHSFGFTVTGMLPLITGMRMACFPDPTHSLGLAEGAERWQVTFFCTAPSFLKMVFQLANREQLRSVHFFITSAEKASQELYQKVAELKSEAKMLEGYGITEGSPVIAIMRPDLPPRGVGQLMPGIELITIHPETQQLMAEGAEGEICLRGPNIFSGYLSSSSKSPFIEIGGKSWYKTGDIGHLEKDGTVFLTGRLKRFTKIGGEMISLTAIEQALQAELLRREQISLEKSGLAICANEKEGKSRLILFTTFALDKEWVNQTLGQLGFSRLIKVEQVQGIEALPLMGTGKVNYKKLQELADRL